MPIRVCEERKREKERKKKRKLKKKNRAIVGEKCKKTHHQKKLLCWESRVQKIRLFQRRFKKNMSQLFSPLYKYFQKCERDLRTNKN